MTYGRERRGVIQKRFGESFLAGKEGSRGKNTEQGFAAVIVFVPRERVDFFDTLKTVPKAFAFGTVQPVKER